MPSYPHRGMYSPDNPAVNYKLLVVKIFTYICESSQVSLYTLSTFSMRGDSFQSNNITQVLEDLNLICSNLGSGVLFFAVRGRTVI